MVTITSKLALSNIQQRNCLGEKIALPLWVRYIHLFRKDNKWKRKKTVCRSIQKSTYKPKRKKYIIMEVHPAEHLEFWFSLLRFGTHRNQINGDNAKEIWLQRLKIIYLATTSQKLKRDSEFLELFPTKFLFNTSLGQKPKLSFWFWK